MSTELRALVALFAGAIGIGAAPICVRLSALGPEAVAFWRLALALPALIPLWLWAARRARRAVLPADRRALGLLLVAGASFAADLGVWHYSIAFTTVANATLLANLAPVFVALTTVFWFRQWLGSGFAIGLVCALGGAALLVGASFDLGGQHVRGDVLGIITAVFYAIYQLSVAAVRRTVDTLTVMTSTTLISAVALWPFALAAGPIWPDGTGQWGILVFLALFSHVAGQGLIAYALAHLPTAFSSAGLLLQPVAAAIFAWLILAEALGMQQIAGGAVVLVGIYWCRRATTAGKR